jgi:hypothetical protein
MAGVTGQGRGKRRTTPEDDLYRAIRAALVERRRALRDEIHATCQAPRLRSRHLFGLVRQRDELKRALRVMAGVKNRWTRQQRKGGR